VCVVASRLSSFLVSGGELPTRRQYKGKLGLTPLDTSLHVTHALTLVRIPEMTDPNSPSLSEPPPPVAPQSHSADQLHSHPLWQRASGRGPVRGGMGPPPARVSNKRKVKETLAPQAEDDGAVRYERISLLAAELEQAATGGDGADSALLSSDDDDNDDNDGNDGNWRHACPKRQTTRITEDEDADEGDDDAYAEEDKDQDADSVREFDDCDDESSQIHKPKQRKHTKTTGKAPAGMSAVEMMAAAAFGGHVRRTAHTSDDEESSVSKTSSVRNRATCKAIFPVKGISCVGCALANRIGPVEKFVNMNVNRMAETALWKMAALTWRRKVVEPAKRENVHVVDWPWRDIASHFRLHTTDSVIGRTAMIQSLVAMRCQVEGGLVRVENGVRTLDKASAELFLKIQTAESKERTLRDVCVSSAARGRGTSQTPAGGDD